MPRVPRLRLPCAKPTLVLLAAALTLCGTAGPCLARHGGGGGDDSPSADQRPWLGPESPAFPSEDLAQRPFGAGLTPMPDPVDVGTGTVYAPEQRGFAPPEGLSHNKDRAGGVPAVDSPD